MGIVTVMQKREGVCHLGEAFPYTALKDSLTTELVHISAVAVFEVQGLKALACVVAVVEFEDAVRRRWSDDMFENVHLPRDCPRRGFDLFKVLLLFADKEFAASAVTDSLHELGLSLATFADLLHQGVPNDFGVELGCTWLGRTLCVRASQPRLHRPLCVRTFEPWFGIPLFLRLSQRKLNYVHGCSEECSPRRQA